MKNQLTDFYEPEVKSIVKENTKDTNVATIFYDVVYLLNLDRSKDRLAKISKDLNEAGVAYKRFSAIDGYNINLIDTRNNQKFSGKDIADKKILINKDTKYKVFCTSAMELSDSINISGGEYALNAGEFGIWCSYKMIWKDIVQNGYRTSIILEDDFVPSKNKFAENLNLFVSQLPQTYDLAYLNPWQVAGSKLALPGKPHVSKFSQDATWYGTSALVINNKLAQKLLANNDYSFTLDKFLLSAANNPILGNTKLEVYVASEKLSDADPLKLSGHSEDSEISKMGSRAWHPISEQNNPVDSLQSAILTTFNPEFSIAQNSNTLASAKLKMLYDVAYIVNLPRAEDRWKKISSEFDKIGLPYQRFEAVDGYNVTFQDITTNVKFSGLDIKKNLVSMQAKTTYKVNCAADESFNLMPYRPLSAGELGVWCSQRLIWKDIVKNNYQNAMVFEDDINIKVEDFPVKLNKFILDMPPTYDLAYAGVYQKTGSKIPLANKEHISKFSTDATWDCLWGTLISNKGATNLLNSPLYFLAVDDYIFTLATKLNSAQYFKPEIYRSTKNMIWYDDSQKSEIENMGRMTAPHYKIVEESDTLIPTIMPDNQQALAAPIANENQLVAQGYFPNLQQGYIPMAQNYISASQNYDPAMQGYGVVKYGYIPVVQNYDKLYVINLARSTKRWARISSILDKHELYYSRFNAVDGYKVEIMDVKTQQVHLGQEIKDRTFAMEQNATYIITCNPKDAMPHRFKYYALKTLIAGEIGVFCSYRMIWQDIILNKYSNTVVLEDDFITRSKDFSFKLNNFIKYLPSDYDVAYIDTRHYKGSKIAIPGKEPVSSFSSDSQWTGLWSTVFSQQGAAKLFTFDGLPYLAPVDQCISMLYNLKKLKPYISTEKLGDHDGESDICAMGMLEGQMCQSFYGVVNQ